MRYSKEIIQFLICFATIFFLVVISAAAKWNATVGYYGSCTMEMLEEKLVFENNNLDDNFLEIAYDPDLGAHRLRYIDTGTWYLNVEGTFPYVLAEGDGLDEVGANTPAPPSVSRNKFIDVKNLNLENIQLVVVTEDALAESVQLINDDGITCTMTKASINGAHYWVIMRSGGTSAAYYCNSAGQPYVALYEDTATDLDFDYIVNNNTDNSVVVEDSQIINIEDGEFTLIDDSGEKVTLTIDNLIFDTSTKNYTLNAYNTVEEGDNYYYTYYTYNITYNITNTYITYIGSNDAYEKEEYEFYYQLPDGRSSADLTADEVAGMSFEFHDVVNYAKSATDVSVRALYHFDGDLEDSSYFSTQGSFTWNEGASITYMEAPTAFDGTLYLDSTAHSFDITLPSNMGSGDATIQFRHYQASEPDTVSNIENSVSIGGTPLLSWDEQNLYYGSTKIASLPIGTWSEIALVRNSNMLYIYLNGLCVHSVSVTAAWAGTISFSLGDTSRAYTMLDELRVLNFAMVEGGNGYTPTSVPFDSNLVLVLPDSARPIADEYWEWDTTIEPVFSLDMTTMDVAVPAPYSSSSNTCEWENKDVQVGTVLYHPSYSGVYVYDGFTRFSYIKQGGSSGTKSYYFSAFDELDATYYVTYDTIAIPLSLCSGKAQAYSYGTYTITLVDTDLQRYSMKISYGDAVSRTFDWGTLYYKQEIDYDSERDKYYSNAIWLELGAGKTLDLMYIEMVPGSSPNTGHKKVTCIYPESEMQPNTAAVQSDIPVNGYTVGGVRPTLPSRGDCWFPVSGSRIQTCYIYTGTMWEEVGCRWYTGSRWIPIYTFDLITLEDLFDIADASQAVTPITSQEGFWRWWQLQWLDFRAWLETKFDALITAVGGTPGGSTSSCEHEYSSKITTEPGCVQPGYRTYTCSKCGHQYTELIDAHGHDWITTDSVPDVLDEEGNVIEEGYDELTCSVCGTKARDYGDGPEEQDLFDALGNFIAEGITWLLDKLTELADSLQGITDTFSSFVEKIKVMAGDYPAFFGAFVALIPEDLATLMWFAVVVFVVLAVWKKWSR